VKQHLLTLVTMIGLIGLATAGGGGCGPMKKKDTAAAHGPVAIPANSFSRDWSNDLRLDKDTLDELHLSDDTVFAYTKKDLVYAIGRSGGELQYLAQPEVSGGVLRAPLVLGERVIYPCGSTIDIFNNHGRPIRTLELDKPTRSGAIGTGNTVYIGLDHTGGTGVLASINIDKAYKPVNWELMTYGAITPTPAMFDRVIFVGSEDGRLYAVTEERGQVWALERGQGSFNTQGRFVSDIKADDFGVYASSTDSKLYCLDRGNGHIKWQYYAAVPLKTSPVVTATTVYQYVEGTGIVAIDKANGTFNRSSRWTVKSAVQVLSEDQTYIYLRRKDNRLMAVDKASGQVVFTSKTNPFQVFTTNLKDSTIYAGSHSGTVWAIKPVLREGEVGTIVMDFRAEAIAVAAR
jgi:outer membrane protein assembly factor BamB